MAIMFILDSLGYRTNGIRLFVKKTETIDGVFVGATSPRRNCSESVAIIERYCWLSKDVKFFRFSRRTMQMSIYFQTESKPITLLCLS